MGGGHQINVLRALGNQIFQYRPELAGIHGLSYGAAADGGVLAVPAPEGAAAEEHRAAAAAACQGRLFPLVEHGFGNQSGAGAAAVTDLSLCPVNTALPGAEFAVYIIHSYTSFGCIIPVFLEIHKHSFTSVKNLL